ncbi:putative UBX domain-containing protein 4-like isoform X2 [Apostichopus japonicus]|uniref:Putative UBX domain-containing protein 4-like isoform X2 n=1 Tax=Stichopus japonicus TaxID=307972 RepID=A0A2G8LIY3_STIJA|nr:putative UBX domain-containing protein 4-like isoform X2 [Apostichopus japonicus]
MSIDDSDDSKKMDQTWESPEVATVCKKLGLVAMRFVKDSSECKMFSQCYPVLIVPSVSFISGENGVLLEATAGQVDAPGFIERINAAAKIQKGQGTSTTDKNSKPERSQTTPAQTGTTVSLSQLTLCQDMNCTLFVLIKAKNVYKNVLLLLATSVFEDHDKAINKLVLSFQVNV